MKIIDLLNKIANEIKEINIPENVLVALGDLTNGALNYYKATETVKVKYSTILDYITNLQNQLEEKTYLYNKLDTESKYAITNLQEENDYLKDIISKTELSDEIKKADKWSKRELYKINYQRLKANQRLQEENEKLKEKIGRLEDRLINRRTRIDKASEMIRFIAFNSERPLTITELNKVYYILQGSDKDE